MTAGAVLPEKIQSILHSLLNSSFNECYSYLLTVCSPRFLALSHLQQTVHDNGYALNDIVTELSLLVTKLDLPDIVVSHILDKLSTLEYRLSHGVSEKIQIGALVGAFTVARNMMQ